MERYLNIFLVIMCFISNFLISLQNSMELDLTPKTAQPLFEGDGGGYYIWSSSQLQVLAKTNVGAGQLVLKPGGFDLPHYADSSKIGYVLEGTDGLVGMVLPKTGKEVVLKHKQGDVIPIPMGAISWWFNHGDSNFSIIYLGETSTAHIPGEFTYFFLNGLQGLLESFSSELISKVYNFNNDEVTKLTQSQKGHAIIKLEKDQPMPKPQLDLTKDFVYDIDAKVPEVEAPNGGLVATLTEKDFPFIKDVGLSVIRVKLEPNAIKAPSNLITFGIQLIYIARGSGKFEIVGLNKTCVLDSLVKVGHLIVVPQFFAVAQIAGDEGMESYSIVTTTKLLFEELAGNTSVWGALSPLVQQVSFNVDSEFQNIFISKATKNTNLIPPTY
ncbi:11S globulin seed storage protein 2-like [Vicia villosa]|uniref:11S globulin seed storage protein 2-like n=1 Tax=Vicia villosa TaxID=3911 RepID=UPI00273BE878|nr:11S globulin seed storage protein 2-like [Vicia villosa]